MSFEKSITNSIIKYLNSLPNCRAEKVQGGATASGRADINACYRGRSIRIEVKTPDNKNKASTKQEHNLVKWYNSGAVIMVVYSLEAVEKFLSFIRDGYISGFNLKEDNGCISIIRIPDTRP